MASSTESQVKPDHNTVLINNASSKFGQNTVIGKVRELLIELDGFSFLPLQVRNFKRFSWWEWIFLVLGIVAFSTTLGLTIERFVYFHKIFNNSMNDSDAYDGLPACEEWTCLSDVTFAILLIINLGLLLD